MTEREYVHHLLKEAHKRERRSALINLGLSVFLVFVLMGLSAYLGWQ